MDTVDEPHIAPVDHGYDAKGLDEDNGEYVPPIQMLPNELLETVLSIPWRDALVCSRWRDIADMSFMDQARMGNGYARTVRASSLLSRWGHMPPLQIRAVLEGVLYNASQAHLLPLLLASNNPIHVDYALGIWSDDRRPMDDTEVAQWMALHDQLESRFDATWPKDICKRIHLDCDHRADGPRAVASCVLLTLTVRHTHQPDVLYKVASFCHANGYALRKAAFVATADDRANALGALLHLYAQHIFGDDNAAKRPNAETGKIVAGPQSRPNAVLNLFQTLYVVAGTHGSLECARIIDLFPFRKSVTMSMIMPPSWCKHAQCQSCDSTDGDGVCRALARVCEITLCCTTMRTLYWLRAAIAADRPEMMGLFARDDATSMGHSVFADTARQGKASFSDAMMAARPHKTANYWCDVVNESQSTVPFTIGGVRWLASQAWYLPQERGVCRILEDLFCQRTAAGRDHQMRTDNAARLANTVEAMGLLARRYPVSVRLALGNEVQWLKSLLVACAFHDAHQEGRDLFGALIGHMDTCHIFARPGSCAMSRAWAYLIARCGAMQQSTTQKHCLLCDGKCMVLVFACILKRYLVTPSSTNNGTMCPCARGHEIIEVHVKIAELKPLPYRYAKPMRSNTCNHGGSCGAALQYLGQHGLLQM